MNLSPQKEQEDFTPRNLIKTYISNMPEPELKTIIIRILAGLEKSIEDNKRSVTADMKSRENKKNAITEM